MTEKEKWIGDCDVCGEHDVEVSEHDELPDDWDGVCCETCRLYFKELNEEEDSLEFEKNLDRRDEWGGGGW